MRVTLGQKRKRISVEIRGVEGHFNGSVGAFYAQKGRSFGKHLVETASKNQAGGRLGWSQQGRRLWETADCKMSAPEQLCSHMNRSGITGRV